MTNDAFTELETALRQFTGSEHYYRTNGNLVVTDGVKFLADEAKCFWLLDLYASHLIGVHGEQESFTVLKLTRVGVGARVVIEDGNGNQLALQQVEYTDFPLASITLYGVWDGSMWIVMLTSEY
ncbi:DUF6876 family protein [Polynucleobacter sinensis]|uniref:DUF6876 family protein n=1 Tax=Polynucleobacter sinensis TaxID=1743157 RepID=UPI000785A1E7|nr:DUF6876 family protein [Polynucleobacter sinensis]